MLIPYKHKPLDLDRPTFRLFVLHPSQNHTETIYGSLVHASFDGQTGFHDLIPYEALSYTWGLTSHEQGHILINGDALCVGSNLYFGLKALRQNKDRWLWIDAICINQMDNDERGHQVRQMSQIYKHAECVIVWLGLPTPTSSAVIKHLQSVESQMKPLKQIVSESEFDCHMAKVNGDLSLIDGHQFLGVLNEGIHELLQNSWFQRVWILQEVASARRVLIHLGTETVHGRIFAHVARLLGARYSPNAHSAEVLNLLRGPHDRPTWWTSRDLYTILKQFRGAQASVDRDRIFALLALCDPSVHTHAIRRIERIVDYQAPVRVVLKNTILFAFPVKQTPPSLEFDTVEDFFRNIDSLGVTLVQRLYWEKDMEDAKSLVRYLDSQSYPLRPPGGATSDDNLIDVVGFLYRSQYEPHYRHALCNPSRSTINYVIGTNANVVASLYQALSGDSPSVPCDNFLRWVFFDGIFEASRCDEEGEVRRLAIVNVLMADFEIRRALLSLILTNICTMPIVPASPGHPAAWMKACSAFSSLEVISERMGKLEVLLADTDARRCYETWGTIFRTPHNKFTTTSDQLYRMRTLLEAGALPEFANGSIQSNASMAVLKFVAEPKTTPVIIAMVSSCLELFRLLLLATPFMASVNMPMLFKMRFLLRWRLWDTWL